MGSIAEKLAAARNAAVSTSGLQTGMKTAAASAAPISKPGQSAPQTPSKTGYPLLGQKRSPVSVLKAEDLIPRRTKESQVLFQCSKPTLNFVIASVGKETRRVHFQNRYLLTEDAGIIEHVRKNAKHFGISEVKQEIKKAVEAQKPVEPQKPPQPVAAVATPQKPV